MGHYRLVLPNLLSSVLFFQILLWLLSFGLSSACCHPLLPLPLPLPPRPPEGQIDQTSIFYFGSGLVRLNSNITKFVLLSVLVCEALAPCCVRWPPRRKGRRRDRKPWFRTFFSISQILWNFSKGLRFFRTFQRFKIRSRKSLKSGCSQQSFWEPHISLRFSLWTCSFPIHSKFIIKSTVFLSVIECTQINQSLTRVTERTKVGLSALR